MVAIVSVIENLYSSLKEQDKSKHRPFLQVICLQAGPNVQRLHSSLCCVFSLSIPYPSSIIQSMSFCLGTPLPPPFFPPLSLSVESHFLECVLSSYSVLF